MTKEYIIEFKTEKSDAWMRYDIMPDEQTARETLERLKSSGLYSELRLAVREVSEWKEIGDWDIA